LRRQLHLLFFRHWFTLFHHSNNVVSHSTNAVLHVYAFGDSNKSLGACIHLKTQGFMQGNGASPAGWTVVFIAILHAHHNGGHGATFVCPISDVCQHVSCILYIDDSDLLHLDLSQRETPIDTCRALQSSIDH
jgi:hypothetical protein